MVWATLRVGCAGHVPSGFPLLTPGRMSSPCAFRGLHGRSGFGLRDLLGHLVRPSEGVNARSGVPGEFGGSIDHVERLARCAIRATAPPSASARAMEGHDLVAQSVFIRAQDEVAPHFEDAKAAWKDSARHNIAV
jgi:hypothetical protein